MTAPDRHAHYDELAVGHALGALEPEDEQVFLDHSMPCARCERVIAAHHDTMAQLAYAAPPVALPPALWEGIRAGVEASDRASTFPGAAPEVGAEVAPDDLSAVRRRRDARGQLTRRFVAATSVAAGFALVLTLVVQNVSLREQQQQEVAYSAAIARVISTYGSDVKHVPLLAPGAGQADGVAVAVAVIDGSRVHLVVDSLAANDRSDSTYVLWERTVAGDVQAVGTFDVTGTHDVEVVADLQLPNAEQLQGLAVTKEAGRIAPPTSFQPALASGILA